METLSGIDRDNVERHLDKIDLDCPVCSNKGPWQIQDTLFLGIFIAVICKGCENAVLFEQRIRKG